MPLAEIIRKHALKNASDYGKANANSIIGKVIAEFPEAKTSMKETIDLIRAVVGAVNAMKKEEIEKELENYTFAEKKQEEKGLSLPNAEQGKVITRFPPEPSGYPHIGHAKAAFLDYESAQEYGGKMILRFDDTNPEKESQEYVEAIKEGLSWLGIKWDSETYTSDNLPKFYEYAEKMIEKDAAYVCTCGQEKISEGREKGEPCQCRNLGKAEALSRWNRMLAKPDVGRGARQAAGNTRLETGNREPFKPGEAILRLKGDLKSQNTAMRDPSLFRILETPHYRQGSKYRVWPTYDFEAPIMDATEGITHAMRSKEYELRDELYFRILDLLELRKPQLIEFSRLAIKNAPISKRLITPLVKEKKVLGWDDPRLPTLKGLARRGILSEAIKNFVLSFGLSKVESEPGWERLLSENRKLLEPLAKHYFFVPKPKKIMIKGTVPAEVELKLHPSRGMGTRTVAIRDFAYISGDDWSKLKEGEVFRLKDLYSVKMLKGKKEAEFAGDAKAEKRIQWVTDYVEAVVLVPHDLLKDEKFDPKSLERIPGYAEDNISDLKEGDIIQFERFGFCRLDSIDKKSKKYIFVYSC